jgi:hypothetical protein
MVSLSSKVRSAREYVLLLGIEYEYEYSKVNQ